MATDLSALSKQGLRKLTFPVLRLRCDALHLGATGKKSALVDRTRAQMHPTEDQSPTSSYPTGVGPSSESHATRPARLSRGDNSHSHSPSSPRRLLPRTRPGLSPPHQPPESLLPSHPLTVQPCLATISRPAIATPGPLRPAHKTRHENVHIILPTVIPSHPFTIPIDTPIPPTPAIGPHPPDAPTITGTLMLRPHPPLAELVTGASLQALPLAHFPHGLTLWIVGITTGPLHCLYVGQRGGRYREVSLLNLRGC